MSIMGFTRKRCFLFNCVFCVLIVKGCCHRARTSSDSLQKRNFSPKWSKLGVAIEYPNLATNTAIFPTKFGCTHEILVFFQHHVEKTLSNILPQIQSLDGPQPRAPDLSGYCRTSARHHRECQIECQKECKNNGRQKECNFGQH